MLYEEFFAEYRRVHEIWSYGRMPADRVTAEIARLRGLVPTIDPADRRAYAEYLLDSWLSAAAGPAKVRHDRAFHVFTAAAGASGTPQERLARYRQAIREIADIADETDDQIEQGAILGYNEHLSTLVDGIEHDRRHPAGG